MKVLGLSKIEATVVVAGALIAGATVAYRWWTGVFSPGWAVPALCFDAAFLIWGGASLVRRGRQ